MHADGLADVNNDIRLAPTGNVTIEKKANDINRDVHEGYEQTQTDVNVEGGLMMALV